jgi:8-oxo-dGTP diphosphatase
VSAVSSPQGGPAPRLVRRLPESNRCTGFCSSAGRSHRHDVQADYEDPVASRASGCASLPVLAPALWREDARTAERPGTRIIDRMAVTPSPRVGVGVVIRRGDELLLQRRSNVHGAGTWSTPGGHLDFGEDPAACAVREAAEETGLTVRKVVFAGVTNDVFDAERHYITLWFAADGVSGEPVLAAPYEMSELGWFRQDELPEPLFPPLRRLLDGEALGPGLRGHS